MSLFRVTAFGHEFDVDGYLATTRLTSAARFRRGSDIGCGGENKFPKDGFTVELGDEGVPLQEQFRVAQKFLEEHLADLYRLRGWPGFESANLGVCVTVGYDVSSFGIMVPAELVGLAGELGFRIGVSVLLPRSSRAEP
jgi:hypothetical protein